ISLAWLDSRVAEQKAISVDKRPFAFYWPVRAAPVQSCELFLQAHRLAESPGCSAQSGSIDEHSRVTVLRAAVRPQQATFARPPGLPFSMQFRLTGGSSLDDFGGRYLAWTDTRSPSNGMTSAVLVSWNFCENAAIAFSMTSTSLCSASNVLSSSACRAKISERREDSPRLTRSRSAAVSLSHIERSPIVLVTWGCAEFRLRGPSASDL